MVVWLSWTRPPSNLQASAGVIQKTVFCNEIDTPSFARCHLTQHSDSRVARSTRTGIDSQGRTHQSAAAAPLPNTASLHGTQARRQACCVDFSCAPPPPPPSSFAPPPPPPRLPVPHVEPLPLSPSMRPSLLLLLPQAPALSSGSNGQTLCCSGRN